MTQGIAFDLLVYIVQLVWIFFCWWSLKLDSFCVCVMSFFEIGAHELFAGLDSNRDPPD
jgi:hypothetical protein